MEIVAKICYTSPTLFYMYNMTIVERVVRNMKKIDEVTVIQEDECVKEAKNAFLSVALIVGILTIIVGICVAVYKYLTPDYLDDFDDYDDDFDDSFFDEDDDEVEDKKDE